MFDWWAGLNPAMRFGTSLLIIAMAGVLWYLDARPWLWIVLGCSGLAMLAVCFPSPAEKKGFHDF